jgi:hypothetical protein
MAGKGQKFPHGKIQAVAGVEEKTGADPLYGDKAGATALPAARPAIVLFFS